MLKNSIQAVAYEKYKLAWMMKQGISLKDLIEALAEQQREDSSIGENKNLLAAYKDWDLDVGFGSGSIWVCFDEFLDNEYQDTQFMRSILTEEEFRTYLDDIGDGWVPFVEAEQLLQEAVQKGILNHAKSRNSEALLIGISRATGWYFEPADQVARELMYDTEGLDMIRAAIIKKDNMQDSESRKEK